MGVSEEFIDQQIEQGVYWRKKLLNRFDEGEADDSIGVKAGLQKLLDHMAEPQHVHQLIEDGKQRGKRAREVLAELAQQALPQCLDELSEKAADDPSAFQQQVELLIEVARNAPSQKRDSAFSLLFERMRSGLVLDEQQDVILEFESSFCAEDF